MPIKSRRKSIAFFIVLGACLVAVAVVLNVGWILLNLREVVLMVLGIVFFVVIITGLVLNTIFLIREIRRNEQHDAFINAVTHELKTPIASIRLYLETLQTRELDEVQQREFYDIMLIDSDRLLRTVEQVLHAGSTGTRGRSSDFRKVDLAAVVKENIDAARTRYKLDESAIRFTEALGGGNSRVLGDAEELGVAVFNLLDNAIKYSQPEVKVNVEVVALNERKLAVRVTDNGMGIPRSQLGRVFKRFYRVPTRAARRVKGTGLGLFIVQSVTKRHGGSVSAESAGLGKGSSFIMQLPRLKA
jgi:two-component system, OmpR family, sensor histidine kinase SenX3